MVIDWPSISDRLLRIIDVEVFGRKPLIPAPQRHDDDMSNIETLIRRAARAAELGVSEAEMAETFTAEGVTPEMAFLAVTAGRIAAVEPPTFESTEGSG